MALLVSCWLLALHAISIHAPLLNPCFSHDTCESCNTDMRCRWVTNMADNYKTYLDTQKGKKHCVLRQSVNTFETEDTFNPPISTTSPGSKIQTAGLDIHPDTVTISQYTGHATTFSVTVTPKTTGKLNVYFLIHLTTGFQEIIEKFKNEIDGIVEELLKIDGSVKIGLGKFSDISVFPFVKLPDVAAAGTSGEMKGYVFSNIQKLTQATEHPSAAREAARRANDDAVADSKNTNKQKAFRDAENVKTLKERAWTTYIDSIKTRLDLSANDAIDEPESVLDAISQVTHCTDIIGWSSENDVYKLMIVLTDTESKRAGHGNIIGNYSPNDGSCKITGIEQTLKTIKTDYIHPHLLEKSLSEKNIRVLILTKNALVDYYTRLVESFKHQVVGVQNYDELTIDGTLTAQIKTVASNQNRAIKFNVDDLKSNFHVTTVLQCTRDGLGNEESLFCQDVAVNDVVTLSVTVTDFKSTCGSKKSQISSYVKVNGFFRVQTTVEQSCECPCTSTDGENNANSGVCSNNGKLICGKCACNEGYEGDTCQCQKNLAPPGSDVECSNATQCGRYGKCVCGKCVCPNSPEQFYGEECSKSDFNCPFTQNGLCNGKGSCVMSRCTCDPGYRGEDCSIEESKMHRACKRYANSDVCTGRGNCKDGICKCNKSFGGKYCEWYNIRTKGCSDFKICMMKYFASEQGNACEKPVETVDEIITDYADYYSPVCVALNKNCQRVYQLHFNFEGTDIDKITVQRLDRAKECHESPDFTKTLIYVCLITAAVTTGIVVIVGFVYHFYFKKRREQLSEEERHKRQWVLNSAPNDQPANDEAAPQEVS